MTKTRPLLHLASGSPRRRDILESLGLDFSWGGVDIDEFQRDGETAADMVCRLALEKARVAASRQAPGTAVIGSDTAVVLDGRVFGKPDGEADAVCMLLELAGRTHEVLTGVALVQDDRQDITMSRTCVTFRDVSPAEADDYWQSGEPVDKAGGYAVQGLGGIFVESLAGTYSGVVGLPVFETAALLARAGIPVLGTHEANRKS
jgi:septum formation protein